MDKSPSSETKHELYIASGSGLFLFIVWTSFWVYTIFDNMPITISNINILAICPITFFIILEVLFFTIFYFAYPETIYLTEDSILITKFLRIYQKRIPLNTITKADLIISNDGYNAICLTLHPDKRVLLSSSLYTQGFINFLAERLYSNTIKGTIIKVEDLNVYIKDQHL